MAFSPLKFDGYFELKNDEYSAKENGIIPFLHEQNKLFSLIYDIFHCLKIKKNRYDSTLPFPFVRTRKGIADGRKTRDEVFLKSFFFYVRKRLKNEQTIKENQAAEKYGQFEIFT